MAEHYQLTLDDYLSLLRRRWAYLLFPFLLIFSMSVAVAMLLPPVYKSTGIILVESQRIPRELIRTTITSYIGERIEIIKQRVMTRENMLKIIDEFGLLQEGEGKRTVTERINEVRRRIEVLMMRPDQQHEDSKNVTFSVSFEARNPEVAHRVADRLVTMFLEENVRSRTQRASETTEFLKGEADKLKVQLEAIEAEIATYKQKFSDALPEHLDLRMRMLERTEADIKAVKREILTVQEEARFLDVQLSAARMGVGGGLTPRTPDSVSASPAQQLARLKVEYAQKSSIYSSSHPDVRALKRKINALSRVVGGGASTELLKQELAAAEAEMASLRAKYAADHPEMKRLQSRISKLRAEIQSLTKSGKANSMAANAQSIGVARVQAKITAAEDRLNSLEQQLEQLKEKRQKLEEQIIRTPQVQRALVSLNRDYASTLKKFKEIQSKQMEAKLAESLEQSKKAESFSLLEPPVVPEKPIKPKRKKITAMGFILALGGSGGLVMLLESIDKRIRGVSALTAILRQRPLVVIPYITTRDEIQRRRLLIKLLIIGAVVTVLLLLLIVHLFFTPLDALLMKLMSKAGG